MAVADLIDAPLRLIASARNSEANKVEWKQRDGKGQGAIEADEAVAFAGDFMRAETRKLLEE